MKIIIAIFVFASLCFAPIAIAGTTCEYHPKNPHCPCDEMTDPLC